MENTETLASYASVMTVSNIMLYCVCAVCGRAGRVLVRARGVARARHGLLHARRAALHARAQLQLPVDGQYTLVNGYTRRHGFDSQPGQMSA